MTISELIQDFRRAKAALVINHDNAPVISTLNRLKVAIERGAPTCMHGDEEVQWQRELKEVNDISGAMLAFYEMSLRNINKRASAKLAFYFATKVIKANEFTQDIKSSAYNIRTLVMFNNMNDYLNYARWAYDGNGYYNGRLSREEFFDILLLGNVFKGWNNTLGSPQFNQIKAQAPAVAANHPTITREEAMSEGEIASDAIYKLFENALINSSFPIVPEGCI